MAFYQVQLAVNAYLRSTYADANDAGLFAGEAIGIVASLAMLGVLAIGAHPLPVRQTAEISGNPLAGPSIPVVSSLPPIAPTPATTVEPTPVPSIPAEGNVLSVTSESGDWVGQGQTTVAIPPSWRFTVNAFNGAESIGIRVMSGDATAIQWWELQFAAPQGHQLGPGTYQNAERAGFRSPDQPVIDIGGNGRGCNQTFGSFEVKTLRLDSQGNVVALDLSFEQHCESPSAPLLRGLLRFTAPAA